MLQVDEKLIEDMKDCDRDGYVVVVGDGKTYDHLAKIKRLYGEPLHKMLIFPGDWQNYQMTLTKVYYHSGLKELARMSGFRAETLTSLDRCSNFKRTHHFLLNAWEAMYRSLLHEYIKQCSRPSWCGCQRHGMEMKRLKENPADLLSNITTCTSG